jgi:hypothetical protein|tara:strand:+ start:328 stop:555 length:228 start_codon:yes stop_codon:yes gene_type:complete
MESQKKIKHEFLERESMSIKLSTKKSNFKKEIAAYVKSGGKVKFLPKQNDEFIIENSFNQRHLENHLITIHSQFI